MTKAELIAHLAAQVQLTKAETAKLLSALIHSKAGKALKRRCNTITQGNNEMTFPLTLTLSPQGGEGNKKQSI